jgi:signal transduction histidine kinase
VENALMDSPPLTPESPWYEILSQASHELATPLGVIRGYVDMLLKERFGSLNEKQHSLLKDTQKSVNRLLELLHDERAVVGIERGETRFRSSSLDLRRVLSDAIAALPEEEHHSEKIVVVDINGEAQTVGDESYLKIAFVSLFWALRRELVDSNRLLVHCRTGQFRGRPAHWLGIAGAGHIGEAMAATEQTLTFFDEKRGGTNLSLSVARRVIDGHGGALRSPQGTRAAAVVVLPRS